MTESGRIVLEYNAAATAFCPSSGLCICPSKSSAGRRNEEVKGRNQAVLYLGTMRANGTGCASSENRERKLDMPMGLRREDATKTRASGAEGSSIMYYDTVAGLSVSRYKAV